MGLLLILLISLIFWIIIDLNRPQRPDLDQFDPIEVARLDAAMWRSYYERRQLRLLRQMFKLVRTQLKAPFWRSAHITYYAVKAALTFQKGKTRSDFNRALPYLEAFYHSVATLSERPLNVVRLARNELEWWIIRRENRPPSEWVTLQARIMAEMYDLPEVNCRPYAEFRTQAMVFRDEHGEAMTEADWQHVRELLEKAWSSLSKVQISKQATR